MAESAGFVRDRALVPSTSEDPRVQRVLKFIDNHLDQPVHLSELAQVAAVERKHLSVLFKRKTGWHVSTLLEYLRITRARQLFETMDVTVADAAIQVGYLDRRTFQRAFKRHTGMTAREFKQQVRGRGSQVAAKRVRAVVLR